MTKPAKSKALKTATPKTGTSLANIDAELAQEAALLKQRIGQSSSRAITVDPTGNFKTPEGLDLGNTIKIVVLDFISANRFYPNPFIKGNPTPPACYALGRVIAEMQPEDDSPDKQNKDCASCSLNQFGSGQNGKSKACKNTRDIAFLLVDDENDEHNNEDAPIYTMSLPPTAIRPFDGAVGAVARALGGPPVKAILTVTGENVGTYAQISFKSPVPNPDYKAHAARRGECEDMLFRHPDFSNYSKTPQRKPAPQRQGARR